MKLKLKHKDELLEKVEINLNNYLDYTHIIQESIEFLYKSGNGVKKVKGKFIALSGREIKFIIKK